MRVLTLWMRADATLETVRVSPELSPSDVQDAISRSAGGWVVFEGASGGTVAVRLDAVSVFTVADEPAP